MPGQDVAIDGAFTGYIARPASGREPGIVVLQEIFGVNQVMRAVVDEYASVGYYGMYMQNYLADGLADNKFVTIRVYPEMGHAFARPGGAHYDATNAGPASGRTITFFRQHLH